MVVVVVVIHQILQRTKDKDRRFVGHGRCPVDRMVNLDLMTVHSVGIPFNKRTAVFLSYVMMIHKSKKKSHPKICTSGNFKGERRTKHHVSFENEKK